MRRQFDAEPNRPCSSSSGSPRADVLEREIDRSIDDYWIAFSCSAIPTAL